MNGPVVVTGAAGWIGAAVVATARRAGMVVPVTRAGGPDGRAFALSDARALGAFLDDVRPTAVINTAGRTDGGDETLRESNVAIVQHLLAATMSRGITFVTIGSAAEYGNPRDAGRVTEDAAEHPESAYARSKLAATKAVRAAHAAGGPAITARLFNVAGPGVAPHRPLGDLIARVRALPESGGLLVLDDAGTERDWVSLAFVAEALLAVAHQPPTHAVVNVCSGAATTIGELALALARAEGRSPELQDRAAGRGPRRVVGDPTRLETTTGLRAHFTPDALAVAALSEPDQIT